MSVKVKVESYKPEFLAAAKKAVNRAMGDIGKRAVTHAQDITPVDTGRLKNSIAYATIRRQERTYTFKWTNKDKETVKETSEIGGGVPFGTVVIGSNVEYAEAIEEGRQGAGGYHMLRDALADHGDEYERILKASLIAGLEDFEETP